MIARHSHDAVDWLADAGLVLNVEEFELGDTGSEQNAHGIHILTAHELSLAISAGRLLLR